MLITIGTIIAVGFGVLVQVQEKERFIGIWEAPVLRHFQVGMITKQH